MGTREAGFASGLPGYRKFESAADREELAALWNIAPERIPQTRGLAYPDIIEAAVGKRDPRPVDHRHQSGGLLPQPRCPASRLSRLWSSWWCRTAFHPTPTSEFAHLVLPAAMWGEKEGTYTNSERRVSKVNRAVTPPGEARPDFDIFLDLAGAPGRARRTFPRLAGTARRLRRMEARLGRPPVRLQRA